MPQPMNFRQPVVYPPFSYKLFGIFIAEHPTYLGFSSEQAQETK